MADLDDLPVDAETIFMLGAWQHWYDARLSDDPIPALDKFVSYGLKIVREIQRQLPEWTVAYFDEKRQQTYIAVKLYLRPRR